MPASIHILGLSGSLAEQSTTRAAVATALSGARTKIENEVTAELFSVRDLQLPLYDPDHHGPDRPVPSGARRLCDAVRAADGLIWASPLYHGTVSGVFKNALDWLQLLATADPPYLTDKVVGLVATAGGVQGLQAVITMEFAVRALRGWAVPLVVPIPQAHTAFDGGGHPTDDNVARQLRALGAEVARAARQITQTGTCDYASTGFPTHSASEAASSRPS